MAGLFAHAPHVHACDRAMIPSCVFTFLGSMKVYAAVNRVCSLYASTVCFSSARGKLARMNKNLKDARIVFLEAGHLYLLDGVKQFPVSVTGVCSAFFAEFDPDAIIMRYFETWSANVLSPYHQLIVAGREKGRADVTIRELIKTGWKLKGVEASRRGTYMHKQIELALNDERYDDQFEEMRQFHLFLRENVHAKGWITYRTEWSIYDSRRMIAGQIDAIFYDPVKFEYHMVDWKRSAKDFHGNDFGKRGVGPCEELSDNPFNRYAAQQNLYAALLLDCYNMQLTSMSLVQLHEKQDTYGVHSVPWLIDMARNMLDICVPLEQTQVRKRVVPRDAVRFACKRLCI